MSLDREACRKASGHEKDKSRNTSHGAEETCSNGTKTGANADKEKPAQEEEKGMSSVQEIDLHVGILAGWEYFEISSWLPGSEASRRAHQSDTDDFQNSLPARGMTSTIATSMGDLGCISHHTMSRKRKHGKNKAFLANILSGYCVRCFHQSQG